MASWPSIPTPSLRLALAGALCVLYLILYFVIGHESDLLYDWLDAPVYLASGVCFLLASRRAQAPLRWIYRLFSIAFGCIALVPITYGREIPILGVGSEEPAQLWMAVFSVGLFFWGCGWGLLTLDLFSRQESGRLTNYLSAFLLLGLSLVFVLHYLQQGVVVTSARDRFVIVYIGLELVCLVLCLSSVLLGARKPFVLMAAGFGLLVASDFVYIPMERDLPSQGTGAADSIWLIGEFLILAGALILPQLLPQDREAESEEGMRSGLSGLLVLLIAGSVFAVGFSAEMMTPFPDWNRLLWVLFLVVLVLATARLTLRFDRAVRFCRRWARELLDGRLLATDWQRTSPPVLRHTLQITGLGSLLNTLASAADRLRDQVLFLGPERLNRPAVAPQEPARARCFLVMPFGAEWSNDVHRVMRKACEKRGVRAVRGDDLFSPTDILDDIWQGINEADCVFADITGRNPNVLYELGMAHTLGKPVVILSQKAEDIPIDLGTRRVILYEKVTDEDLGAQLDKCLLELIRLYGLRTGAETPGSS